MAKTEAQKKAVIKYRKNRRKNYSFAFRLQEDFEILESIEKAKSDGITKREWFRRLYNGKRT